MTDSPSSTPRSRFVWKAATTLGAVTGLIASQLTGCASTVATEGREGESQPSGTHAMPGGGEGHPGHAVQTRGEGEGAPIEASALATDDIGYLTHLGLIRGHLAVGYSLYDAGLPELAETHMKHPRAEIYRTVEPAFGPRGCGGFGAELTALTNAVVSRQPQSRVAAVYRSLTDAIGQCEFRADVRDPTVVTRVIENLLRTGGMEYQVGVIDGRIDNLHEYQDAWGFTQIAGAWARSGAYARSPGAQAVGAQIDVLVQSLQPLWPSLNPGPRVNGEAAQLFGAAGRTEVIGLALSR